MFANVDPFVRYVARSTYFIDNTLVAPDCRIIYIISGEGSFTLPSGRFSLFPSTLVYYPCGVPYHISSDEGLLFYTLNFDFTRSSRENSRVETPRIYGQELIEIFSDAIPKYFKVPRVIQHADFAEPFLKDLYSEAVRSGVYSEFALSTVMKLLLINICRNAEAKQDNISLTAEVKKCICDDLTLNNQRLAKRLSYHPYYLNEVFRKSEGISLHKYIVRERIARARELISTSDKSFDSIAQECGFFSASHLCRAIKMEYGITPSIMRRM